MLKKILILKCCNQTQIKFYSRSTLPRKQMTACESYFVLQNPDNDIHTISEMLASTRFSTAGVLYGRFLVRGLLA